MCVQALSIFYNILPDLFSCYVPSFPTYLRSHPTWFTAEILNNIRLNHALQEKFRTSKNDADHAPFEGYVPHCKVDD